MKKEETINLDSIWIDVVKAIDNIKNNDSEKAKQLIESINEINMALKSGERDRIQSYSLKLIGILLFNSIKSEKAIQATQEAGKIAINQAIKNFIPRIFGLRHQRPT